MLFSAAIKDTAIMACMQSRAVSVHLDLDASTLTVVKVQWRHLTVVSLNQRILYENIMQWLYYANLDRVLLACMRCDGW